MSQQVVTELPEQKELKVSKALPEYDLMKAKKKMDSIFKVRGAQKETPIVRMDSETEDEPDKGSETSSLKTDLIESEEDVAFKPPQVDF